MCAGYGAVYGAFAFRPARGGLPGRFEKLSPKVAASSSCSGLRVVRRRTARQRRGCHHPSLTPLRRRRSPSRPPGLAALGDKLTESVQLVLLTRRAVGEPPPRHIAADS